MYYSIFKLEVQNFKSRISNFLAGRPLLRHHRSETECPNRGCAEGSEFSAARTVCTIGTKARLTRRQSGKISKKYVRLGPAIRDQVRTNKANCHPKPFGNCCNGRFPGAIRH